MKDLIWMGDSRYMVQSYPKDVKHDVGFYSNYAQLGHKAENVKPIKGLPGVFEIRFRS